MGATQVAEAAGGPSELAPASPVTKESDAAAALAGPPVAGAGRVVSGGALPGLRSTRQRVRLPRPTISPTRQTMIRKLPSGEYRLYSRKTDPRTGKRRNLGTFRTRAAAERHERAVQYFKHH